MLDLEDEGGRQQLATAISQLKCEIELPDAWQGFFEQFGPTKGDDADKRQFPRWINRKLGGLLCRETFPVLPRCEQWYPVYLKDVSLGGVAFIHSEQLFPLERMRILLIDDVSRRLLQEQELRSIEIAWCRRVQNKCFEVGARLLDRPEFST